ncbi:MAG: relaxase/mobilization nuclease domain-containing protein, partial [Clostridia bacterium]|nr:relaxase/mobilization nuclease domain-containing protein [Clostridia bacterium]
YVHIVQAFSPDDDVTPEMAHEIGLRFAEYFGGYQALVATHRNTDHIHNHIILNSVNMETGKKFHQSAAELIKVKEFSNALCREYSLSETEAKSTFKSMPKWKDMLRRKAYSVANNTCCKEDFIYEMEMHGYKVDWKEGHKYITFTTPDGHKCRDNKLFAEQLLRKNLEIYFALGGCESGLADQYKSYVNNLQPEHSYTVGDGLFNLLKNLLETMPYEGRFTPPIEDHQLDKMTVMMLESMGIKVEPKALLKYSANNEQEQEYGLYM